MIGKVPHGRPIQLTRSPGAGAAVQHRAGAGVRRAAGGKAGTKGRGGAKGKPKRPTARVLRTSAGFRVTVEHRRGMEPESALAALEEAAAMLRAEVGAGGRTRPEPAPRPSRDPRRAGRGRRGLSVPTVAARSSTGTCPGSASSAKGRARRGGDPGGRQLLGITRTRASPPAGVRRVPAPSRFARNAAVRGRRLESHPAPMGHMRTCLYDNTVVFVFALRRLRSDGGLLDAVARHDDHSGLRLLINLRRRGAAGRPSQL
jgi:hypothetical protein